MFSRSRVARGITLTVGLICAGSPLLAQQKIAVIDVARIMTESKRGQKVVAELEKLQGDKRTQLEAMNEGIVELRNRIQEGRLSLAEDALEKLQAELQEKGVQLERAREDAERQLQTMQQTDIKKVENDVMPIIEEVGRELGYSLIFNKFQSGLVFAGDGVDITDEILARFDAASGE
jgi:outer membrane protein